MPESVNAAVKELASVHVRACAHKRACMCACAWLRGSSVADVQESASWWGTFQKSVCARHNSNQS